MAIFFGARTSTVRLSSCGRISWIGRQWYDVLSALRSPVPILTILAFDSFPDRTGHGLALVDYDKAYEYKKGSKADIELGTEKLVDALVRSFRIAFPGLMELDVRFYGGWTDERGLPSPMALLLSGILPGLRGRRRGLIVRPSVTMVRFPDTILRGTVRLSAKPRRQKMVNGMRRYVHRRHGPGADRHRYGRR